VSRAPSRLAAGVAAALVAVAAGCGGGGAENDDASAQAREVVRELRSLERGEILIQGVSPRVYGPYTLAPGGYVLRFEQSGSGEGSRLVVALESKPGSRAAPYRLVVDSADRSGTRRVTMSGKLYVHVTRAGGEYELRLTPRRS
jgi:hypothetical protein